MFVRKPLALAGVFLLCVTYLRGSTIEADPHELYEAAQNHLRDGELEPAGVLLARLRSMISHGSRWDPDGVFANELLPPLLMKLRRMQAVSRELDAFSDRALNDLKPPEITGEASTLSRYTDWATSVIQGLRSERDRIITSGLSDPEEQAALTRTTSYARTERLLETDVLRSIAESAEDSAPEPPAGDPQSDPVLVRFRQLKQDLMQVVIDRDRLERQAKTSRASDKAYLNALASLVTEGSQPAPQRGKSRATEVSDLFGQHLDRELEEVRRLTAQTSVERDAWRAALDRYRRYNGVLTRAGLGKDQSERIQALAQAVEGCPVNDETVLMSSAAKWSHGLLTGILACIASFSSWLAVARGRQLADARKPDDPKALVIETTLSERDVRGNAA